MIKNKVGGIIKIPPGFTLFCKEVLFLNNVSSIINNMKINFRKDNRYEGRITIHGKRKSFYGTTKTEVKQKAKEYIKKV